MKKITRRQFLTSAGATSAALLLSSLPHAAAADENCLRKVTPAATNSNDLSWDMAEEILTHISDPVFPAYTVNVLDYGAVPNDGKLDTAAIQRAIDETSAHGGGTVVIPSGVYDVGAITLKSNVNLHLESKDTVLRFTRDITPANYPLVFAHYEGSKLYNWSPLIYAYQQENIALTGKGTLDGQADKNNWWNWSRTVNPDGSVTKPSSGGEYGIFMEAFEEVPITGLVFRNVNISNVGTDIRALNWEAPVMENVTINGKTYPRPVETKILGVPVPGQRIEGSSTLLGGEDTDLSSKWLISDSADGDYHFFRIRRSYAVPSYLAGKYIKFVSTDRSGNQDTSIPYKVLRSAEIAGTTNDAELLRAASKGYIDENDALDLNRPITKRECAKMLGKLWNLTAPSAPVTISDVPASDPDYGVIAAVVEAGMIELKDPTSAIAQGTLYNAGVTSSESSKRTAFLPDATIDRDEMGHIALLSCGVPYNETLGTQPKFDDASQIESVYKSNVGASAYFGFITAKTGNSYLPKEKTTLEDLIRIVERISDFSNK